MNIDMSFVYWASVFSKIRVIAEIIISFGIIFGICLVISHLVSYLISDLLNKKEVKKMNKCFTIAIIPCLVVTVIYIFIPAPDSIYAAGIAENITNNQKYLEGAVESTIDKIVDAAAAIKGDNND